MQPKMHLLSTNFTLTVGMLYRCPHSSFQSRGAESTPLWTFYALYMNNLNSGRTFDHCAACRAFTFVIKI